MSERVEQAGQIVQEFLRGRTRIFGRTYPHWIETELVLMVIQIPGVGDYLKDRTEQMKEFQNANT